MVYKYNYTTRTKEISYSKVNGNIYTDNKISISTDGGETFYIYHSYENPPYNTEGRWYNLKFISKNLIIKLYTIEFIINFNDVVHIVTVEFSPDGFNRIMQFLELRVLSK